MVKYVSMTNHMWSGFNLMAHLRPGSPASDIKEAIERNAAIHVRRQREEQEQAQCRPARRLRGARHRFQ